MRVQVQIRGYKINFSHCTWEPTGQTQTKLTLQNFNYKYSVDKNKYVCINIPKFLTK